MKMIAKLPTRGPCSTDFIKLRHARDEEWPREARLSAAATTHKVFMLKLRAENRVSHSLYSEGSEGTSTDQLFFAEEIHTFLKSYGAK